MTCARSRLKVLTDDRGFLMEMLRADDPLFEGFGQVYVTVPPRRAKPGTTQGATDHFICVSGVALAVLYDSRQDRRRMARTQEFVLTAPPAQNQRPLLLKIPPLVSRFRATGARRARIINVPTRTYRYENPDEYRFPWGQQAGYRIVGLRSGPRRLGAQARSYGPA